MNRREKKTKLQIQPLSRIFIVSRKRTRQTGKNNAVSERENQQARERKKCNTVTQANEDMRKKRKKSSVRG